MKNTVFLISSGDLRLAANKICWPAQLKMEKQLTSLLEEWGYEVIRAHEFDPEKGHGFIDSQKMGIEVFKRIDPEAGLIIAESVWQYSNHVLAGLTTHKGPVLTLANWDGQWPGLVGMLNLNGCLIKAGINYCTLWSKDFSDAFFQDNMKLWLEQGSISRTTSHVKTLENVTLNESDLKIGKTFGADFKRAKAIMGVFDEGCMGMFNAIVPDHLLHRLGIFKERLSQSALYARMKTVTDERAEEVLSWLLVKGMKFNWGENPETELTRDQTLQQCKMYIAAVEIADEYGCDTIGIQYQQGLKDLTVASDLAEGLLNNTERPPVLNANGRELYAGQALPHFNEVDECAGIDTLVTYRLWQQLGLEGDNTLHDVRWGEFVSTDQHRDFVWVFQISGALPPSHLKNGYADAVSERQPAMYFHLGGGSLKGVSKPGDFVWSRVYVKDDLLQCDLGIGKSIELSEREVNRRWEQTTIQWPIMNAVLSGISRDEFMSRHASNHIQIVYVPTSEWAHKACRIKAAALAEIGIKVHFCGDVDLEGSGQV